MATILKARLQTLGMESARLVQAMRFTSANDLLDAVFEATDVTLTDELVEAAEEYLARLPQRAAWASRVEGAPGYGTPDLVLWNATRSQPQASSQGPCVTLSTMGVKRAGPAQAWRPSAKRATVSMGLGARDASALTKWTDRLVDVLREANTPSWQEALTTAHPEEMIRNAVGKARPATIKKRVRAWEQFSRWLRWNRHRSWPTGPADALDYLYEVVGNGCPKTFPASFRAAVNWVEARGGVAVGSRVGENELFRKNLDRNLGRRGSGAIRRRRD